MQHRPSYAWFDLFRFLAASMVVLEHARDMLWVPAAVGSGGLGYKLVYFLTGFGHESVMVFFVLSGFWITATIDRRRDRPDFWGNYLVDRIARLMVVLLPALVIGGAFDLLGAYGLNGQLYQGTMGTSTINKEVVSHLTPAVFAGNLLFLQSMVVPPLGSNGPLWSLAYEFWYYLWYPSLLLLATRRKFTPYLASLVIAVLWPKLVPGFAVWMLGSVLYRLDLKGVGKTSLTPGVKQAMLGASTAVALVALSASRLRLVPGEVGDLAVGLSFFALFWSILLVEPPFAKWLRGAAKYGSDASFSLYVTHFPFIALAATAVLQGTRLYPGLTALGLLAGVIVAAWGYGWIFSRMTEGKTPVVRGWLKSRLAAEVRA